MATQRYKHEAETNKRNGENDEKKTGGKMNESATGEGDGSPGERSLTGEGDHRTACAPTEETVPTRRVSNAHVDPTGTTSTSMSTAAIRRVRKQSRRRAKGRRVQRAMDKQKALETGDEVERALATLEEEQRLRREQQAFEARRELAERWQQGSGS
eukprot:jgi/Phyca11/22001/fgenesh1_pg.PHYCAscaffold_368_\